MKYDLIPSIAHNSSKPRPVQYFTPEYLSRCRKMKKEQILAFLEDFALLQQARIVRKSPGDN